MANKKPVVVTKPTGNKKPNKPATVLKKAQTGGAKKSTGPSFKNPIKPTQDSTKYYEGQRGYYWDAAHNLSNAGEKEKANKARDLRTKAANNRDRQANKGKAGYDANGFPMDYKKKGGQTKKK